MDNFLENLWDDFYQSIIFDNRYLYILDGLKNTVIIAIGALVIGIILGLLVAIVRDSNEKNGNFKICNLIVKFYVGVIRGTPALLQLMIIYYVIFKTVNIDSVLVGILAFGINSGAYVSEIIRAGIGSVDKGQLEASLSLGFNYSQSMKYVVLPQAIKNVMPAMGNEFITLIKETSVAGYIGIRELTKASDIIASRTYNYFFPLIVTALIYLFITTLLTKFLGIFERKIGNA